MLSPDNGELFTVGIVLNKTVQQAIKKQIKSLSSEDKFALN
jgi:hypothetical protein